MSGTIRLTITIRIYDVPVCVHVQHLYVNYCASSLYRSMAYRNGSVYKNVNG